LLHHEIIRYEWIVAGLALGTIIGIPLGLWVPMTAMPERIALSHAFGALAAALVGVSEYYLEHHRGPGRGYRPGIFCGIPGHLRQDYRGH